MQFEMIASADAPPAGPERRKRRMPEVEEMVAALRPGMVARITLGEDEKPRPVIEQIYRSAARHGKIVDLWESGGLLYAEESAGRD